MRRKECQRQVVPRLTTICTPCPDLQSTGGNEERAMKESLYLENFHNSNCFKSFSFSAATVCEFVADQWFCQCICNRQLCQGFPCRSLNPGKSFFKCSFQSLCPGRLGGCESWLRSKIYHVTSVLDSGSSRFLPIWYRYHIGCWAKLLLLFAYQTSFFCLPKKILNF